MNSFRKYTATARFAGVALSFSVLAMLSASCTEPDDTPEEELPVEAVSQDGDWIRLDGTIVSTAPSTFVLDYGDETITVEVDDWDLAREGVSLLPGDRVSVTGRVDKDIFLGAAIEASAIYLHEFDTVHYANAADEEEFGLAAVPLRAAADGVDYTGWVTGASKGGFKLGSGAMQINVDTSQLSTPLAKEGIDVGDRVYVWGDLELPADAEAKLMAEGLVELINGSKEKRTSGEEQPASADGQSDSGSVSAK